MRFIIYGAGAVGGTIGALLFEAGNNVVFIARGEHGRVIAERGLTFAAPDGSRTLRVPVVFTPAEVTFGPDDVVVLAVKSQDTAAAVDALAAAAPPGVHVVCAQNGVGNEPVVLRRFANVHAMCVRCSTSYLEPGTIRAYGTTCAAICDVGRYPAGTDAVDEAIAAAFTGAKLLCEADPQIMVRKYAKLLVNVTNVPEAAGGPGLRDGALGARIRAEAIAVFRAAGIAFEIPPDPRNALIAAVPVDGRTYEGNSTWQSLERGAAGIEADALNGEIVLLGRLHGVPTPANAALQGLAHRMQRDRIPAGSLSVAEIEREVADASPFSTFSTSPG